MDPLPDACMSIDREDYVFRSELDPDMIGSLKSLDTMQWIEWLKRYIVCITFITGVAPYFEERALEFLDRSNDGTEKLTFLARFLDCDRHIMPMMPWASHQWKKRTLMDFYRRVYEHPLTNTRNKIMSASYLLDRAHDMDRQVVQRILQTLLEIQGSQHPQNPDHVENWDIFDLLHRHTNLMADEDRQVFRDWAMNHRRIHRQPVEPLLRTDPHLHPPPHPPGENHEVETPPPPMVLTTDSQNVHTVSIHRSMRRCLDVLCGIPPCDLSFDEMSAFILSRFPRTARALQRIRTDPSLFQGETICAGARLVHVFEWVVSYIYNTTDPDTQEALWNRLDEELSDAGGTCCTGHITRLVNVLVGFHPDIHLTIDDIDHIKIRVCQILAGTVDQDGQDILADMIEPTPDGPFCRYLKQHRAEFMRELDGYDPDRVDRAVWALYPTLANTAMFQEPKSWWVRRCTLM